MKEQGERLSPEMVFDEVLMARQRVYAAGDPTPLQQLPLAEVGCEVWAKREDLGPIKAYKWRGAYNKMASLTAEERGRGVVAASAGNHAQGVALAARKLGCQAVIYMPTSTPEVKQHEVKRHGQESVEVRLVGDSYDDAGLAAKQYCEEVGAVYVHPYDDVVTMGGQGTVADEVVMSGKGPFDRVYIAVGGGGLASGMASWLQRYWPECKVIGVEGRDQASMAAAIQAGEPTELSYVDVFCDGTAVRKVGEKTFQICNALLSEMKTVSNDEVCHAVRKLWETLRVIPEPSGAMGLAAILKDWEAGVIQPGEKVLTVVCGANMDFAQLAMISRRAGIGSRHRRYLRVPIEEGKGSLVGFLQELPKGVNMVDVQYGRVEGEVQYPVLGLIGTEEEYAEIDALMERRGAQAEDVSTEEVVGWRVINYDPELFQRPLFVTVEFPERAGAFLAFMEAVREVASLCYFNYEYSGERVGRALVGMEFDSLEDRQRCEELLASELGGAVRNVLPVSEGTLRRLVGSVAG